MRTLPSELTAVALMLGMAACSGGSNQSKAANEAPATAPAQGAAQAPPTSAAPAATAAEFGVPECDEYVTKYLACIDSKVPDAARAMVRQQFDQTKAQWRLAAATPQGKAGLAMGCKAATDAAKTAMQAYGCTW